MIGVGEDAELYDLPEPTPQEAMHAVSEVRRVRADAVGVS